MNEQQLSEKFLKFLEEEKGYPKNSLLSQAPAYSIGAKRIQADLLLLDTRIGNYIGIIEFKNNINPNIKKNARHQIEQYLKVIKSESLPSYLVFPLDENDFQILVYGDEDWISIKKDEFPEFETLSAKKKIEEKTEAKEAKERTYKNIEIKREIKTRTSLWTLTSLILGLVTAIVTFYISIDKSKNEKTLSGIVVLSELEKLENRIKELELKQQKPITSIDSIRVIDSSSTYKGVDNRLKIIENGIIDSPEKTLAYNKVQQKIELLREQIINQEKLIALRNENLINRIEWLNAIVIGMVIALFGAAIGFVISNYNEKKNTTANTV
ncbi:hypothetical protein [Cyclobacterium marinum]|uniref:hypothetical protein n=1 Tax=Cyclobacterium marinum TaxID=104 RepID=UPI0011EBDD73|nr:hypothetical protein [Cyclobacterium marinum]MBI0400590.1 hypothetical protein [Cyclobacterium marinum]